MPSGGLFTSLRYTVKQWKWLARSDIFEDGRQIAVARRRHGLLMGWNIMDIDGDRPLLSVRGANQLHPTSFHVFSEPDGTSIGEIYVPAFEISYPEIWRGEEHLASITSGIRARTLTEALSRGAASNDRLCSAHGQEIGRFSYGSWSLLAESFHLYYYDNAYLPLVNPRLTVAAMLVLQNTRDD